MDLREIGGRHEKAGFAQRWKDVAASFGRLGFTAYGGPAIMGIMQAELQERRQWVTKGRFVEGTLAGQPSYQAPPPPSSPFSWAMPEEDGGAGCSPGCVSCYPDLPSCSR